MQRTVFLLRIVATLLMVLIAAVMPSGIVASEHASEHSPASISSPEPSATPHVVPQPNVEHYALDSFRPADGGVLRLTIGQFDSFIFWNDMIAAQWLRLRDPRTGTTIDFLLSTDTTLNGKPLPCSVTKDVGGAKYCESIPGDTFPKGTYVAVLYWPAVIDGRTFSATDTIATMPASQDRK